LEDWTFDWLALSLLAECLFDVVKLMRELLVELWLKVLLRRENLSALQTEILVVV